MTSGFETSGFEKSPDYGGPEPKWQGAIRTAILAAVLGGLMVWMIFG